MSTKPYRARVSQARWCPPADDRPSPRTTALVGAALGLMSVAAAAFLAWAVSVDRDRASALVVTASASVDLPSPRTQLPRKTAHEVEGAFVPSTTKRGD